MNSTDRLRECVTKGGRGSRNVKNLRDVIYGWSLRKTFTEELIPPVPTEFLVMSFCLLIVPPGPAAPL